MNLYETLYCLHELIPDRIMWLDQETARVWADSGPHYVDFDDPLLELALREEMEKCGWDWEICRDSGAYWACIWDSWEFTSSGSWGESPAHALALAILGMWAAGDGSEEPVCQA